MLIILVYIVFNIGYILGLYQELGITWLNREDH